MSATSTLPHWDMTVVFPGLDSPEFVAAMEHGARSIAQLRALFDAGRLDQPPAAIDDTTAAQFERLIGALNAVLSEHVTLLAYVTGFVSTDSRDTLAQARASELQQAQTALTQLVTRFIAWLGTLEVEALITRSRVASDHAFALRQARVRATHLMSPAEEALAAELNVTGAAAWEKLYDTLTSQITVPVEIEGQTRDVPMTVIRNMAYDPDRAVRQRAYEAELAGWGRHAAPLAAAMNSIKGQGNTLARRRGWASPLDAAIFGASIDRATLDAMMSAARDSFPDFRRYLRAKARGLGIDRLAFYDLFAPMGGGKSWSFADSSAFVIEQFGTFSPKMRELAARAFRERWVDAEPRPGKRGGAFCMPLRADESRVLANFEPSYEGMSTLSHELGHAYHNVNLAHRTAIQRDTPMTLAETASIFCETLVKEAALRHATPPEQLEIIQASLQGSCQTVVDITSRFLFEQRVFARREQRELSVEELCAIMREAQIEAYGDGVDEARLHPYMWAAKPHYYSGDLSFYNFPYMFGLLFGLGLYARYQRDPEAFARSYDDLLSSTGLADAATLAARFDIDTRAPDFWRGSLDVVRADIARFEALVG